MLGARRAAPRGAACRRPWANRRLVLPCPFSLRNSADTVGHRLPHRLCTTPAPHCWRVQCRVHRVHRSLMPGCGPALLLRKPPSGERGKQNCHWQVSHGRLGETLTWLDRQIFHSIDQKRAFNTDLRFSSPRPTPPFSSCRRPSRTPIRTRALWSTQDLVARPVAARPCPQLAATAEKNPGKRGQNGWANYRCIPTPRVGQPSNSPGG